MTDAPSIVRAVADSIRDAKLQPRDRATAVLARHYAEQIESARAAHAELALIDPLDEDAAARVARLSKRVEAVGVMADLGPKLLAALTALGCNPGARASKGGTPDVPATVSGAADALADLRTRRATRSAS